MTKIIILDTNFLLIPAQFKVDIFSEIERICNFKYQLVVIDKTLEELQDIAASSRGKDSRASKLAIKMINKISNIREEDNIKNNIKNNIKILKTSEEYSKHYADRIIIETAEKNKDVIVATQDRELKRILKDKNTQLIVMKNKSYLDFA